MQTLCKGTQNPHFKEFWLILLSEYLQKELSFLITTTSDTTVGKLVKGVLQTESMERAEFRNKSRFTWHVIRIYSTIVFSREGHLAIL